MTLFHRVALVTGGSRGIGAAIVKRLAANGFKVAFTYVSSAPNAEALVRAVAADGGEALALRADNRDAGAVEQAVRETAGHFGRLDVLVNNAGVLKVGTVDALSLDDFDETMAVNVRASFAASRSAASLMEPGSRIIGIGSILAARVPWAGQTLYATSKTALVGLTRGLARDLGPKGITVSLVQPGPTDTDMNPAKGHHADRLRATMALPEYAAPDDVAGLVLWLTGSEARHVTGGVFTMDGGSTI